MEKAIVVWQDGRQQVVTGTAEQITSELSLAKLLGAKVLCQIAGEWIWS